MEKVLITGITGFVGSHLADYLLSMPDVEVHGTRRWHLSRMDHVVHIADKIIWHDCNILDASSVRKVVKESEPDIIFHMASESFVSPSWDNPREYMDTNYLGTVNFLDAIHEINPKIKFHIPGSGEEYGDIHPDELPINEFTVLRPVNPYAVTKVAQDLIGYVYYRSYGIPVYRTRTFNHEGPRREKVYTLRQALERLIEMSTVQEIRYITDPKFVRPTKVPYLIGDTRKFREQTGWVPQISFEQILSDTLEYWRARV